MTRIDIPAIVLTGDKDQIIPPEKARALAESMPAAVLSIVENAGHMPMMEQPGATTTAIGQFMNRVASSEIAAERVAV